MRPLFVKVFLQCVLFSSAAFYALQPGTGVVVVGCLVAVLYLYLNFTYFTVEAREDDDRPREVE